MLERQALIDFIASGERQPSDWRIGTEYEKHVVNEAGRPLPYDGDGPTISGLLQHLADHRGWSPVLEGERVIGLLKNGASITLEPGGQVELSGAPFASLGEMERELAEHVADLDALGAAMNVRWLWAGANPCAQLNEIPWMPKARYAIMRAYLPSRGALAHSMMKATATVQANLDFADERDMGRKLRLGMGLSSLVTALFANSPMGAPGLPTHGTPTAMRSWRWHVWSDTDPDRCGLLPWVFDALPPSYEQWVDYALDVPMFLLEKQGQIIDMAGRSFRDYAVQGHGGHEPTMEDWSLHLSTLFPDVRLKTYLEMRSADTVSPKLVPALPALWKGLLYDNSALDAGWDLVKGWTFSERLEHRADACRYALEAPVPGKRYLSQELAKELVAIAQSSLPEEERASLDPLAAIAASGRTPADETIAWLSGATRSVEEILEHYGS